MMYLVVWTIDLEADCPVAAARQALEIQRDAGSIATVFLVKSATDAEPPVLVDLSLDDVDLQ